MTTRIDVDKPLWDQDTFVGTLYPFFLHNSIIYPHRKIQTLCLDVQPPERLGPQLPADGGQAVGAGVQGGEGTTWNN